ncbi:MAG: [FeFe] hydrogenase H-cluster radical SAM maturase HydE [Lentisphaerae bacterium]|nr:[FeFe] hydrogenase H-cluster radical SAM maturase HydE [Lentisphaerota bacterium]
MTDDDLMGWLRETDAARLAQLWTLADETRRTHVGDDVHLRGLIEVSNHCTRQCGYCGLRGENRGLTRYRMSADEVLEAARQAYACGYGTVVMQAGEDPALTGAWVADVVMRIKRETGLAVTLSLGERDRDDLRAWREAGADRYLLRFETSDRKLFQFIHPGRRGQPSDRLALLREIQGLGYETGSGIMMGVPGQTYASVLEDLRVFRDYDFDMIGIGPFIPHPDTPLGGREVPRAAADEQVPNSELMVYKAMALTRLLCPDVNMPSTSALATINRRDGREQGLQRGANVVMPNLTPVPYRRLYAIYPDKACINESATTCHGCLNRRLLNIGRRPGRGPGGRHVRGVERGVRRPVATVRGA